MKRTIFSLVIALVIAAQFVSPAAAAPSSSTSCGDTYTVQPGDYLVKIANLCGTTVYDILIRNPQIFNPNRVYAGQVLRLTGNPVTIPPTGSVGTYTVQWGDTLQKIAIRFGINMWDLFYANPGIGNPAVIYAGQVLQLPYTNAYGYYGAYYGYYPNYGPINTSRYVVLSASSVKPGGTITATVRGYPANVDIDFRAGKQGQTYSVVLDGKTDANGSASATLTIPASAVVNDSWVVFVPTTEITPGVESTSAAFKIVP